MPHLSMRHKRLYNEGVDGPDAAIHINDLPHACFDEALHPCCVQIQANLKRIGVISGGESKFHLP